MKIQSILGSAALALALIASAQADVTVTITGATAFRSATLDSIRNQYLLGNSSGKSFKFAHDQAGLSTFNAATRAIFIGNFPGVSGNTTIQCCFTGSVEGIRALVVPSGTDPAPPTYYPPSLLSGNLSTSGGTEYALNSATAGGAAALSNSISDIAFSDVKKASTPFAAYSLKPTSPQAGVIVFAPLGNKGCPLTNITGQQFRALLKGGYQPLSLFTGNATQTDNVYMVGRNDGSGTRTTLLAEVGFGITNAVNQFVSANSTSSVINIIQKVPAGGVNTPTPAGFTQSASNASTIWGLDQDGNGGYNSSSALKGDLAKTTAAVDVYDADGATVLQSAANIYLVSWISLSDAKIARDTGGNGTGAKILGYNGVTLSDFAADTTGSAVLSKADTDKITSGLYTAWGYENMYYNNSITAGSGSGTDKIAVFNAIKGNLALGTAGIKTTDMKASRSTDGGTVGY